MRLGHAPSGILLELAVVRSMARAGMAEGFHQCHRSCSGLETPVGYRRSCKPFPRYVSVSVHSVLGRRICSLVSSSSHVLTLLFGAWFSDLIIAVVCRLHCEVGYKRRRSVVAVAAIAQLGERQTEDLKVPGSIPDLGTFLGSVMCGGA